MESRTNPILQQSQQLDSLVGVIPAPNWRIRPPRYRPRAGLPGHAGLGRPNRVPNIIRLVHGDLPIRRPAHCSHNDRERELGPRTSPPHHKSSDENLSLFSNSTVASIETGSDLKPEGPDLSAWPILSIKPTGPGELTPKRIAARLLVGADGINSPVRSFADISTHGWDYGRHGIVATLALGDLAVPPFPASKRTAYQRFLPALGGPIALLPLPNNHATLVWSTTPENAAYLKSLSTPSFLAMVNAAFRLDMTDLSYMMGMPSTSDISHQDELTWRTQHTPQPSQIPPPATGVQEGTVASFPLRFRHAAQYVSPRVALVGDAAHVIHPLAGQGLNLGLADVASLSKTIQYAVSHGMDVGDLLTLERYSSERYLPNAKIGGACDLLHKMYTVPGEGPVAWARSVGLGVVDRLPFVKSFLMKNAEGY